MSVAPLFRKTPGTQPGECGPVARSSSLRSCGIAPVPIPRRPGGLPELRNGLSRSSIVPFRASSVLAAPPRSSRCVPLERNGLPLPPLREYGAERFHSVVKLFSTAAGVVPTMRFRP